MDFTRPLPVSPYKESEIRPLYQNVILIFGAFKVEATMVIIRQKNRQYPDTEKLTEPY